ncbi:hypothetical protein REPUB_Repub03eG0062500 [Reevesia pubescens]
MVGQAPDAAEKGKYTLIKDVEDFQTGIFDKPLPCFGCGIGWFCFLLGFVCPLMWFYATFHYFGNHYRKDPRERAGLAASAIAFFFYFQPNYLGSEACSLTPLYMLSSKGLHANQISDAWAAVEETVAPEELQYEKQVNLSHLLSILVKTTDIRKSFVYRNSYKKLYLAIGRTIKFEAMFICK